MANERSAVVSHSNNLDMLLVRVGHHLWRWWKTMGDPVYLESCETVWEVKKEFRHPLLVRKEANREAFIERIHGKRQKS